MSGNQIDRRNFLKIMGWSGAGVALTGCDMPTTVTLEEGKETVVSYLQPEEYVIPGLGVWYASTCTQCAAACGVHGRVREGRVLKLEGNPNSPINKGGLCQMGQAAVQAHYNPDRLQQPLLRKGDSLQPVSWDEAWQALEEKVGANSGISGNQVAWFTGTISGHQAVLLDSYLSATGSSNHYVYEILSSAVGHMASKDILNDANPTLRLDEAKAVLSLGADLVGVSESPSHFSSQYAKFREAPRGVLMQVEPKMTLTGANADMWVPVRPGTEGVLAMAVANQLIAEHGANGAALPAELVTQIRAYDLTKASGITGISVDRIEKIARWLAERSPSLVVTGASAEGHAHGYQTAAAAMMLNVLLGNVGKTVVGGGEFPFPQLKAKSGNTRDLFAFLEGANQGTFKAAFFYNTNPVYTAPAATQFADALSKVAFKVVLTHFPDETAMAADLVLPLDSGLEDWGTHVAAYQPEQKSIAVQQPLMNKLYKETRGFGDIMLALLKTRQPEEYAKFDDYYAYLRDAFSAMPGGFKGGLSDEQFWRKALQEGVVNVQGSEQRLSPAPVVVSLPDYQQDTSYPFHLVPSPRLGLWDGRHANLPWLQEAPDQISKVVWGSWAEIHPKAASQLGVKTGDFVEVTSEHGTVTVPVYVHKGIHQDVIAVPMGQGHEAYGRYAQGRGANPMKLVSPAQDQKTGELATYATRVKVIKAKPNHAERMVRFGGSETQMGRKLVATTTADVFNRTEGA